jgi:predicted PurR-regulated permease PerM
MDLLKRLRRHTEATDGHEIEPRQIRAAERPEIRTAETQEIETGSPQEIGAGELRELATVFAAPKWLRDLGRTAWLLVGLFALLVGVVWFLGATYTIGGPLVVAMVLATVTMPIVTWLSRHMPRALAAVLVLLGIVAIGVVVLVLVLGGITAQHDGISAHASSAADKAQSWMGSVGVDKPKSTGASSEVKQDVPKIISTLTKGIIDGIRGIASLVFGLSLAALSLFFLLKDGPSMRAWLDRHLGLPPTVAQTITGNVIRSLRGYFRGVTLVAAFNGVVVALGAWILGVPLAGTIGVVTFVTAYVPFIGAFVAGFFTVVIALGAKGTTTAVIMLVIVILANGLLQNLVQPFAMGAALDLHPLVVLVVTIASGCIFGTIGLILAAPLLSAAVHATRDLARARGQAGGGTPASSSAAVTS